MHALKQLCGLIVEIAAWGVSHRQSNTARGFRCAESRTPITRTPITLSTSGGAKVGPAHPHWQRIQGRTEVALDDCRWSPRGGSPHRSTDFRIEAVGLGTQCSATSVIATRRARGSLCPLTPSVGLLERRPSLAVWHRLGGNGVLPY